MTNRAMSDFVKSRLNPVLEQDYYSTIVDKDMDSIETKRIRDSYLYFRSSSKASTLEGIDVDYVALN